MTTDLDFTGWMAITGGLLMVMALSSAYLRRLPVSTAAIYLVIGVLLGPLALRLVHGDVAYASAWFERASEVALVVSLFVGGLKLRMPLRSQPWKAAFWLAGPVMLATIACVALFAHVVFGLNAAMSLLLGAMLAPTDPVLASAVSVNKAADDDRLRYALSGEAGLNDGLAYPFVMFALAWQHERSAVSWIAWTAQHLLWAIPAGLAIGFYLGKFTGRIAVWLRSHQRDNRAPTDFLALALIALAYVAAQASGALGFLAVFAAGVGLRHAERTVVAITPHPDASESSAHPPAEELVPANVSEEHVKEPAVAAGVLLAETISFGDTAERLLEVALVVLIGLSIANHWDVRALGLALAFFVVIRPGVCWLFLRHTPTTRTQRRLIGWFGVRGIGSLYYLSFALRNGLADGAAKTIADLTISVVAISIVAHGVTAQPLLER
ncbi:MAG TPA: sodium:proton antiporter, partial [Polyangiales bacterium]|nr:sodium:proton antiporter [Polyangiales bacterium]